MTRPESARRSNEQIAEQAERYHFVSRVPMLCECSDAGCRQIFLIALEDYRRARRHGGFLTAPGHAVEGAEPELRQHDYWLQRHCGRTPWPKPAARRLD